MKILVVLAAVLLTSCIDAHFRLRGSDEFGELYDIVESSYDGENPPCPNIDQMKDLRDLMEKICELCHNLYSHQDPNMQVKCRADCFRNEVFKRCMNMFTKAPYNTSTSLHEYILDF